MDNQAPLAAEVAALQHARCKADWRSPPPMPARCKVDWRFTTADARVKLKRLYPNILP